MSSWLAPACRAPIDLSLTTLESGALLRWNATDTALAVGHWPGRAFYPFPLRTEACFFGAVTLIDLASKQIHRSPFRGLVSAIPGRDEFVISGTRSAVVGTDGEAWGECVAEGSANVVSSDGRAVALSPGAVCQPELRRLVRPVGLEPFSSPSTRVAFWPGSEQLYYVDNDEVHAWDARSGHQVAALPVPNAISQMVASPDGTRLAILARDDMLSLWDVGRATGTVITKLPRTPFLAFTASGKALWVFDLGKSILIELASRRVRELPLTGLVLASAADVGLGLASKAPNGLTVWRPREPLRPLHFELDASPKQWALSDDGTRAAVVTARDLYVFELGSGKPLRQVSLASEILALAFRPHSTDLAFATPEGVHLLSDGSDETRLADDLEEPTMWSDAASPNNDALAAHVGNEIVRLSLLDGSFTAPAPAPVPGTGVYAGVTFRRDGAVALRGDADTPTSPDGRYQLLSPGLAELREGSSTRLLDLPRAPDDEADPALRFAVFAPDSRSLLGVAFIAQPRSSRYRAFEWATDTGQLTWSEDVEYADQALATRAGWLIGTRGEVARFEQHRRVFSGQGSHDYAPAANLLGVVVGQTLQLVDESGRVRSVALPFREPVRAIKLDPAGARVALGTEQGLYVLSTTNGAELARSLTGMRIEPSSWRDKRGGRAAVLALCA
jgi:hypothetical protein